MNIIFKLSPEAEVYLASCARIRDITITSLTKNLIETIARDQLVLSILDDDSKPATRAKHGHRFRERPAPK